MDELLEVKRRVAKIYSLTSFDACYALLLALKPLFPLLQYEEHASALEALEQIKSDCITQLGTYIKVYPRVQNAF